MIKKGYGNQLGKDAIKNIPFFWVSKKLIWMDETKRDDENVESTSSIHFL